jgi:hypothetical protein
VTPSNPTDRFRSLLDFPWELSEYQRFIEAQARAVRAKNDMFADDRLLFEPRPEDVLVALDDIVLGATGRGVRLSSARVGAKIEIEGMTRPEATRILGAIDGTRTAAEIAWQGPGIERFLRSTFGLVVFAPQAVAALECELSGCETTRFPSSPYGIARSYWANMIDVRRTIKERIHGVLGDPSRGVDWLRELHVIATMGASLDSFYKPSSPVSDAGVMPGGLWNVPARMVTTQSGTLFLSGPRAKMNAFAGERYHQLIYNQVGDPAASDRERRFVDDEGHEWGKVLVARAPHDEGFAQWYCLPRPFEAAHFDHLFGDLEQALVGADHGDIAVAIEGMARFHWRYVHLHPFRCANQCIAMNIVNYVLAQVLPSGMPHLVLDSLALRLRIEPYVQLFDRAVKQYTMSETDPAARYARLREQRQLAFSAMRRVGEAAGEAAALEVLKAHPDEASAALLEVG